MSAPTGAAFVGDMEGALTGAWELVSELGAPNPVRVTSPVRRGSGAAKMTVAPGQKRSELQAKSGGSTLRIAPGSTWWFADSMYLASGFPVTAGVSNGWQTVLQWKDAGGTQSSSPPLSVDIKNGRFTLYGGWGCPGGHREFRVDLGPTAIGRWIDFEFQIHFNTAGKGWVSAWVDSVQKVNAYKPPCGTAYPTPYSQFQMIRAGYYRDPAIRSAGTMYHDEYRMGSTRASVSLASTPSTPAPAPTDTLARAIWSPPANVVRGNAVTFDGSASLGDQPLVYTWTFENADGSVVSTRTGAKVQQIFNYAGTKHVRLTVKDADGDTHSNLQTFAVT
jgi:hypothetical protein